MQIRDVVMTFPELICKWFSDDPEFFNKAKNMILNESVGTPTYIFAPYVPLINPYEIK